jgi:hypothetical protein
MAIPTDVLTFALTNARTPQEAAYVADRLGDLMVHATPKVCFPPDWVRKHRNRSVATVAFMIRNCDDPATLEFLVQKDKRLGVRVALSHNSYLSDKGRQALSDIAKDYGLGEIYRTLNPPAPVAPLTNLQRLQKCVKSATKSQSAYTVEVDNIGSCLSSATPIQAVQAVTRLIRGSNKISNLQASTDYLLACYALTNRQVSNLARARDRLSVTTVVEWLPLAERTVVLTALINKAIYTSYNGKSWKANEPRTLDLEATTLLIKYVQPSTLDFRRSAQLFDASAVELLCANPGWIHAAVNEDLADRQFATLVATAVSAGNTRPLSAALSYNPKRLEILLPLWDAHAVITGPNELRKFLGCLDHKRMHLLPKIVDIVCPELLANYLSWEWQFLVQGDASAELIPDVSEIAPLLGRFSNVRAFSHLFKIQAISDDVYLFALIDVIPTLAYSNMSNPEVSEHIFQRIVESGLDLDLALEQFSMSKDESLNHLCAVLLALRAATS